jgi:hypothetical protein
MVPALAIVWCSRPFWERASGGIVIEGRVLIGLNRIGGEWGHIRFHGPQKTSVQDTGVTAANTAV